MNYWESRSLQRMLKVEKDSAKAINQITNLYDKAIVNIEQEIVRTYKRFYENGELNQEEALKLLNNKESEEYYNNIYNQINMITDDKIKIKLLAKYNAPAYSSRISRLEALRNNLYVKIKQLASNQAEITKSTMKNIIDYSYNNTMYDFQQQVGYYFDFEQINEKLIESLMTEKWIGKGNYSSRIWNNSEILAKQLERILLPGLTIGRSISKMSAELKEIMNVAEHSVVRLVRTESNYHCNNAELLAYNEAGTKEYIYLATLDTKTCEKCGSLDLKTFKIEKAIVGENFPPIHANDRCTTIPKTNFKYINERIARDSEGKTIKVSSDMNYKEWKDKFAPNLPKIKSVGD